MFALMERYYENVSEATFAADLEEKQSVIMLADPVTGAVCGFSTQTLLEASIAGRPVKALFSGDTIIARERWGDRALARVWGRFALSLIDRFPTTELYWFLISKGYKTYRFLPLFFHEFYPRYDVATPDWAREIIDCLAQARYPTYDPAAGIVRADEMKDRLRPGVADVGDERLSDPHVQFFVERNPGHARGDELCCIAPLTRENFTAAAYRVIGTGEPAMSARA
jgi:hypothetical protein